MKKSIVTGVVGIICIIIGSTTLTAGAIKKINAIDEIADLTENYKTKTINEALKGAADGTIPEEEAYDIIEKVCNQDEKDIAKENASKGIGIDLKRQFKIDKEANYLLTVGAVTALIATATPAILVTIDQKENKNKNENEKAN